MGKPFTPSFQHFQKDVERALVAAGQTETNALGQTVFRGYPTAVGEMFRLYLEKEAHAPLVAEFRKWNWEWGYDNYLLELTAELQRTNNWPLLLELWSAVIAKRRTNYNKTKKAQKSQPDKIPQELVAKTQALLLDSLQRIRQIASELGHDSDVEPFVEMITRVESGKNA